jgi:hypothetical protein
LVNTEITPRLLLSVVNVKKGTAIQVIRDVPRIWLLALGSLPHVQDGTSNQSANIQD